MSSCCAHDVAAGRLFSRLAGFYGWLYRRKGLERSQRQLLEGVMRFPVDGARVLDIGCGVGYLHHLLLEKGAAQAVGVDLSERMLAKARELAEERGLAARTEYRQGDFVALADDLGDAEVTLVDKVICCYPDAQALVRQAVTKTRETLALTYPRDRRWVRAAVRVQNAALRLFGSDFRNYVHDPRLVESWIIGAGFEKAYEQVSGPWLTQVFRRRAD